MKYETLLKGLYWLVAISILVVFLVFLTETITKKTIIELKPGTVVLHTHRDGQPMMVVSLQDGDSIELVNWTEPIGARVEVPVVTGFTSLLGILYPGRIEQ